MLKKILCLIGLGICLSSCIKRETIQFEIPGQPVLPIAVWSQKDVFYCTDAIGAKALLEQDIIRDAYEEKLKTIIKGCNQVLK